MKTPFDLEFPVDIESYLPPDLWRKLSSGQPQRRLLIQALDRLRSLRYLLSTFIPSNLVQEKMKRAVPGLVSGEMLKGTLLFADVSGFTALSERLAVLGPEGAERLTATMNGYFVTILKVMSSSGGILLKFAGDAMLIYFPEQENNQQAQWAVRAGMRMLRAIKDFASIETPIETASLRMKVGVSTGDFLSASVGSVKRMEYAILGDAVSQTMAAEGAATGAGQLVINQTTADCLDSSFSLGEHAPDFYLVEQSGKEELGDFEIKAETRRARGSIPLDASPQALVAQMEDTLEQIRALRPYIADELVERIIAHAQQRKVESQFLTATVLFCNFVGPEALLEIWGQEGVDRVTNLLSAYFTAVSDVITRYGGIITRIDPYSKGTKLLALFGALVSHQDDPLRAVRAALMMNVELEVLNERWHKKFARHLPPDFAGSLIQHRIGITVGETFAGQVGSSTRREYTVMGDDVNLSARLMGAAKMGQILISQPVYEAAANFFFLTELSPIQVKGKSEPIPIYQADGPRTDTLLNRVHQRGRLVGRDDELAQGEKLLRQALRGECASLTIQGPAGIGKSHLADMLLQQAISDGAEVLSYQSM
ncbi:MAG: adenylate/guanylate cyclase domain-containing protein [Anaerolineales bacterium]|nr:adenylate/guanylate cyclase domain-containing protein [Anaerolineales bacterium]